MDYPIVYCNEAFCKMSGYNRAEVMQKSCRRVPTAYLQLLLLTYAKLPTLLNDCLRPWPYSHSAYLPSARRETTLHRIITLLYKYLLIISLYCKEILISLTLKNIAQVKDFTRRYL